jgi:phage head maturation protease
VQSGTLRSTDTPTSLNYELDLPPSPSLIADLMDSGVATGMSPGFIALADEWGVTETPDGLMATRLITSMMLVEVSIVDWPSYTDTTIIKTRSAGPPTMAESRELMASAQRRLSRMAADDRAQAEADREMCGVMLAMHEREG